MAEMTDLCYLRKPMTEMLDLCYLRKPRVFPYVPSWKGRQIL